MRNKLIPTLIFKSFAEEDKDINKFFKDRIEECGFKPTSIDSITADKTVDEKVKSALEKHDVVFIILTKRFKTSDGPEGLPPYWPVIEAHLSEAMGKVIGFFHGAFEWGPRALGNRSIIVDPRLDNMKDLLNKKIKKRESFRPFAPSVLKDKAHEWFEKDEDVPFMTHVFKIIDDKNK